jgi:hypothetical protein
LFISSTSRFTISLFSAGMTECVSYSTTWIYSRDRETANLQRRWGQSHFRFSQQQARRWLSSVVLHSVVSLEFVDVSEARTVSTIRVTSDCPDDEGSKYLWNVGQFIESARHHRRRSLALSKYHRLTDEFYKWYNTSEGYGSRDGKTVECVVLVMTSCGLVHHLEHITVSRPIMPSKAAVTRYQLKECGIGRACSTKSEKKIEQTFNQIKIKYLTCSIIKQTYLN